MKESDKSTMNSKNSKTSLVNDSLVALVKIAKESGVTYFKAGDIEIYFAVPHETPVFVPPPRANETAPLDGEDKEAKIKLAQLIMEEEEATQILEDPVGYDRKLQGLDK